MVNRINNFLGGVIVISNMFSNLQVNHDLKEKLEDIKTSYERINNKIS